MAAYPTPDGVAVVILGAGRSRRLGGAVPKACRILEGRPLLAFGLETALGLPSVTQVVLLVPPEHLAEVEALLAEAEVLQRPEMSVVVAAGGPLRSDSVRAALTLLEPSIGWVVVHDAARPFASLALFVAVLDAARRAGAATAALAPTDAIRWRAEPPEGALYLDRSALAQVQTPQAFRRALLEEAHRAFAAADPRERGEPDAPDDASLVSRLGHRVELVPGERDNFKITFPEDWERASALVRDRPEARLPAEEQRHAPGARLPAEEQRHAPGARLLAEEQRHAPGARLPAEEQRHAPGARLPAEEQRHAPGARLPAEEQRHAPEARLPAEEQRHAPGARALTRVGQGYDIHRLVRGRPLHLAGVQLPFDRGLLGHSDADVACHAAADALLGAAGLGDLGEHFPSGAPEWKDAPGPRLLGHVAALVRQAGYEIGNLDVTILAEAPPVSPHRPAMRAALAGALGVAEDQVSVKATSTEGLGPEGARDAISAHAVALLFAARPRTA